MPYAVCLSLQLPNKNYKKKRFLQMMRKLPCNFMKIEQ